MMQREDTSRTLPQLLNPITEDTLDLFIARMGDRWGAQEKFDGKRILLVGGTGEGKPLALNRSGLPCRISTEILDYAAIQFAGTFILDGEAIGDKYYAFDLLERFGDDLRVKPYGARYQALLRLCGHPNGWPISPAPLIVGEKLVRKFLAELKARKAEGIVLKDLLAPYTAGRPASGGPQLKCPFYAKCSAVVVKQNEQRSVMLALYQNATEGVIVGNVTIPANHQVPPIGAVVEIRYLYAYRGGALYQPVYLGERDDVEPEACSFEKQTLKYKPEPEEEA